MESKSSCSLNKQEQRVRRHKVNDGKSKKKYARPINKGVDFKI